MPLTGKGTNTRSGLRRGEKKTGGRTLLIVVVISLALMTIGTREAPAAVLGRVRTAFQTVTMPVRYVGSLMTAPFTAAGNIMANLTSDQETLSELKAENQRLLARNAELEEAAMSTERLEALLALQSSYSLTSTGARIISGSSDSWAATVIIDKGTSSGVAVGMPVTDGAGVIGQIIDCGLNTSLVRLITDENSGVSAMVQQSRAQGVLKGTATGSLRLTLIRTDQTVEAGNTVITSGLGGVFPKGLPLGKVVSVEKSPGALYYEIVVEPLSSAESLEEVLVITAINDAQRATAEDIAEADKQETSGLTKDDALEPLEISSEDDEESTDYDW